MKSLEGISISKTCPKNFSWRGVNYTLSKMDQSQADRLADDPDFKDIQRKKAPKKSPPSEK